MGRIILGFRDRYRSLCLTTDANLREIAAKKFNKFVFVPKIELQRLCRQFYSLHLSLIDPPGGHLLGKHKTYETEYDGLN